MNQDQNQCPDTAMKFPPPKMKPMSECPRRAYHTEGPGGYVNWHEWAAKKARTHKQLKCPGCGHFAIWVPIQPTPELS